MLFTSRQNLMASKSVGAFAHSLSFFAMIYYFSIQSRIVSISLIMIGLNYLVVRIKTFSQLALMFKLLILVFYIFV